MLSFAKKGDQSVQRRGFLNGYDLGPRHHDVSHREFAELEQIGEHPPLGCSERDVLPLAFLDDLLEALAHLADRVAPMQQMRKPFEERRGLLGGERSI